jgi:TolA-binding protein
MNHSFGRKIRLVMPLLLLIAMPGVAVASAVGPQNSPAITAPWPLYQHISKTFWQAENQLQSRADPFSGEPSPCQSPLSEADSLYQKYFYVDNAAGKYLQILDAQEITESWTLPPVLYLGGVAAFTIGDYKNAEKYFSSLLKSHSGYNRDPYISDNYDPNPDFSQPVKPGVSKLLFYCELKNHATQQVDKDAFAAFQQFNQTALKVLLTQQEFAVWLANRPYKYQRRDFFFDEDYGEEPDQRRATALPKTSQLIIGGWQKLFPAALKNSGALKMRGYLRDLSKPDSLLNEIAAPRLAEVDQLVIKQYFARAKVLLARHDFAGTRKMYKQIIAEYPNTDASRKAEDALPGVVPIAVNYFQKEGQVNFHPEGHVGVPQTKALSYFEKMFQEDPDGGKADYALYYWARSLGTEGKFKEALQKLQDFEEKFPRSKLRSKALFLEGFLNGDIHVKKIELAAQLMEQTAQRYPKSEEAPEALWYGAFYYAQLNQFSQAIACLDKLERYPKSPRAKYVEQWRTYFQKKIQTGEKWP